MFNKKYIFLISLLLLTILLFSSCGGEKYDKNVKPHILLITIDTLRRDHLGAYGYARETSPFIDQLAKEGTMFKHVVTPIPSTASSHSSILTSLHPLTHGVKSNADPLTEKVQTIAEVMQKNGYHTIGTVSVVFLSSMYNFSQGFDSFSDKWDTKVKYNEKFQRIAESTNESLFKQVDEYLENEKTKNKPLFIWVHYFDPHFIYHGRKHITFKNKLPKWENDKFMKKYDQEIRYTDEHIEKLYKHLEQKGLMKQMVTCITGDHGEQFHDHGASNCHADIYSENTFVPLIFHGYGIPENKTIDPYVSTLDIAPTLLNRCGLAFDYPVEGFDLLKAIDQPEKYPKRKLLVIGNAKYTRSLQLVDYPLAFILNFDFFYKYWYLAQQDIPISTARFKPVKKRWIKPPDKDIVSIALPHQQDRGTNYMVFRGRIKKNKGLSVQVKMLPYSLTKIIPLKKSAEQFTVIYPVTIRDRIFVHLLIEKGTVIDTDAMSYALIPANDLPSAPGLQKFKNQVYEKLLTLRKNTTQNEIYNLSKDVNMIENLIGGNAFRMKHVQYKKLIYGAYRYFYNKRSKLLRGTMQKENYSEREKEMLKSLGYL
jgi:arylsulfatase A-like enzyme